MGQLHQHNLSWLLMNGLTELVVDAVKKHREGYCVRRSSKRQREIWENVHSLVGSCYLLREWWRKCCTLRWGDWTDPFLHCSGAPPASPVRIMEERRGRRKEETEKGHDQEDAIGMTNLNAPPKKTTTSQVLPRAHVSPGGGREGHVWVHLCPAKGLQGGRVVWYYEMEIGQTVFFLLSNYSIYPHARKEQLR